MDGLQVLGVIILTIVAGVAAILAWLVKTKKMPSLAPVGFIRMIALGVGGVALTFLGGGLQVFFVLLAIAAYVTGLFVERAYKGRIIRDIDRFQSGGRPS